MQNFSKYKKRILILSILVLYVPVLLIQQNIETKDNWNKISTFLKTDVRGDENIMIIAHYEIVPFSYYFSPECFKEIDLNLCANKKHVYPLNSVDNLENVRPVNETWLIISRADFEPNSKEILNLIERDFEVKMRYQFILNENSKVLNILSPFLQKKDFRFFNEIEVRYLTRKKEGS